MWAWVAGEMCKGCRGDVQRLSARCGDMRKQSQLLLLPTKVGSGLQVEFDDNKRGKTKKYKSIKKQFDNQKQRRD